MMKVDFSKVYVHSISSFTEDNFPEAIQSLSSEDNISKKSYLWHAVTKCDKACLELPGGHQSHGATALIGFVLVPNKNNSIS